MRRHLVTTAALSLSLALVGCSGSDDDNESTSSDTPTAEATPTESPDVDETEEPEETEAPEVDGEQVSAAGVTFVVPRGWQTVDASDVAEESGGSEASADMAERLGMTPEQFAQVMANVDLYAVSGDGPVDGFMDNINVISEEGVQVGDPELVEQQLQAIDADVESVETVETSVGEGVLAIYQLSSGGQTFSGQGLQVATGDGAVTITVSAGQPDNASDIMAMVMATLEQE